VETIQAAAIVCRYCGRDLVEKESASAIDPTAPARKIPGVTPAIWRCSRCGRQVHPQAEGCAYCKQQFPAQVAEPGAPKTATKRPGVLAIIGIIAGIVLFLGYLANSFLPNATRNTPRSYDSIAAWVDCKDFVTQNLKAPATAEFPLSNAEGVRIGHIASTDRWSVIGYVDAQNGFGAMIRQDFACQVSSSAGNVTLHVLKIGDTVLRDT